MPGASTTATRCILCDAWATPVWFRRGTRNRPCLSRVSLHDSRRELSPSHTFTPSFPASALSGFSAGVAPVTLVSPAEPFELSPHFPPSTRPPPVTTTHLVTPPPRPVTTTAPHTPSVHLSGSQVRHRTADSVCLHRVPTRTDFLSGQLLSA